MKKKSKLAVMILIGGYTFLYLPLLLNIIYSFNSSRVINVWEGFSFKWYKEFFQDSTVMKVTITSLKIAVMSATIACLLGTSAAIAINNLKGAKKFLKIFLAQLIIPDVVLGFALLLLFVSLERIFVIHTRTVMEIVIAHVTLAMPYVISVIYTRLTELDNSLEEAAMDLGATPIKAFTLVTLPLIMPSVALGWVLSFVLSLDDVVLASFVSGPGVNTLPMYIFSSIRFGISPQINVLTTLFLAFLSVMTLFITRLIIPKKVSNE